MSFRLYEVWQEGQSQSPQQYDSLTEAITKTLSKAGRTQVVPVYKVLDNLTSCLTLEIVGGDTYYVQGYSKQDGYGLTVAEFDTAVKYLNRQGWNADMTEAEKKEEAVRD